MARYPVGRNGAAKFFPIVGIGASAGGLPAILKLFSKIPPDSGMAYVLVPHLNPTEPSRMAEILGAKLPIPVHEATDGRVIEPNQAYVIQPNVYLTVRHGILRTVEPREPRGFRRPIDLFLHSLAQDARGRAIAIILSGTGTNGSAGLRAIKAEGGYVIAQDPDTAEFSGMPRAAIATTLVDLILPPESMADALLQLLRHPFVRAPDGEGVETDAQQLNSLLSLLHAKANLDFRAYKKQTLLRRIRRRMALANCERMGDYIELLRRNAAETDALVRDLLISVSGFFRDPDVWDEFDRKVIAPLVSERATGAAIRAWVPGCATGEEAYTIAMLLLERAQAAQKHFDIKIFATDTSAEVLSYARNGVYPSSIAQEVPRERLERFFTREEDTYRISKAIREAVTFAPQNVLQDPPFTRLDLVSCRNLLI